MFSDRLDFLMTITKTSNSMLSRNVALDASYVSRLRSGERKPNKEATYIAAIAEYIAMHCQTDFCKETLLEVILGKHHASVKYSQKELVSLIKQWLLSDSESRVKQADEVMYRSNDITPHLSKHTTIIYYGVDGLISAINDFFNLMLSRNSSRILYVLNPIRNRKVLENPKNALMINDWISKVLKSGYEIKVVHSYNKEYREVLALIDTWMPFYMTGSVELYYYPYNKGAFEHISLIAPGSEALTSHYFSHMTENMLSLIINDRKSVEMLAKEFEYLLSYCNPLFHSILPGEIKEYKEILLSFEYALGDCTSRTNGLGVRSIPKSVIDRMLIRAGVDEAKAIQPLLEAKIDNLDHSLKKSKLIEIISLDDPEKVKSNQVNSPFSALLTKTNITYNLEEYRLHLENMVAMLKKYKNYFVIITEPRKKEPYNFCVKKAYGIIFNSNKLGTGIFMTHEKNVTAAFHESQNEDMDNWDDEYNRAEAIKKLEGFIAEL